jgi:hypothetical protein
VISSAGEDPGSLAAVDAHLLTSYKVRANNYSNGESRSGLSSSLFSLRFMHIYTKENCPTSVILIFWQLNRISKI